MREKSSQKQTLSADVQLATQATVLMLPRYIAPLSPPAYSEMVSQYICLMLDKDLHAPLYSLNSWSAHKRFELVQ